jgi:hypothetical protein
MKTEMMCDFCRCNGVEIGDRFGDWRACEACAALARTNDIERLVERGVSSFTTADNLPSEESVRRLRYTYRQLLLNARRTEASR